jgi:hypothetical protein
MESWLDAVICWFKFDGGGRVHWVGFTSIEIEVEIMSMEMNRTGWSWNKVGKMTVLCENRVVAGEGLNKLASGACV